MSTALATTEKVALNADVVGYSRLLADDFETTKATMEMLRGLVSGEVEEAGGILVDFTGDNFMALFDHAKTAVKTAISITSAIESRNADVPSNRQLRFRMGIDMGDVGASEDRYFGDALNIAARIQAIAPEGGLSVSAAVYRQLDEPALRFKSLGPRALKNIPEQIDVYEFRDLPQDRSGIRSNDTLSLEAPTVAVLPIHTETVDPDIASTAGVVRSDLIHRLSRVPQLLVFDAGPGNERLTTPARYVIESGVHVFGDKARVYAQVIDVNTWNIVKAHKKSAPVSELFTLSEDLAEEIATAIEVDLIVGAPAGLYSDLADPEAIEKIYRGWYHLTSGTPEGWERALDLFDSVANQHQDQPYGHVLSAFANWYGVISGVARHPGKTLDLAYEQAEAAQAEDDPTGMAAMVMASVLMSKRQYDQAVNVMEQVEIARPTCDATYGLEGSLRRYMGDWERAIDLSDTAMRLTGVNKPWYPTVKACSLFMGGKVEQAASVAEMVLEHQPNNLEALLVLAAAQVELGLERRAQATAELVSQRFPAIDVERWLDQNPYQDQGMVDRWKDLLVKAGVLHGD